MMANRKQLFTQKLFLLYLCFIVICTLFKFDNILTRQIKSNLIYFITSQTNHHDLKSFKIEAVNEIINLTRPFPPIYYEQINTMRQFHKYLQASEKRYYSQNKEDGVLVALVDLINCTYGGSFVEIGTESGIQTNTRYLREKYNWKGLYLDNKYKDVSINLHRENVTHQNVLSLLEKYNVNETSLDLLSEDTDFADYWILEKILLKYKPKLIVHEINEQPPPICVTVLKPLSLIEWVWNTEYHGASLCAFQCLAKRFDYTIVYCESAGVNCFWMRNDLLYELFGIKVDVMWKALSVDFLWRKPDFVYRPTDKDWHRVKC
jgi:hypothetical protein